MNFQKIDLENEQIANQSINTGNYTHAVERSGLRVELMLKEKIVQHQKIPHLFDPSKGDKQTNQISKFYRTHDLELLMNFCGLYEEFQKEKDQNSIFTTYWSLILKQWSVELRYKEQSHFTKAQAEEFIIAVNYIILWIRKFIN